MLFSHDLFKYLSLYYMVSRVLKILTKFSLKYVAAVPPPPTPTPLLFKIRCRHITSFFCTVSTYVVACPPFHNCLIPLPPTILIVAISATSTLMSAPSNLTQSVFPATTCPFCYLCLQHICLLQRRQQHGNSSSQGRNPDTIPIIFFQAKILSCSHCYQH